MDTPQRGYLQRHGSLGERGDPATTVALPTLAAVDVALPAAPELPLDALQRLPELGAGGGDAASR